MLSRFLSSVVLLLALAPVVVAQTQITTGVIQGLVSDSSGAVIPGVAVEARNVDTNLTRTAVTNADGRFVLLQLPPGPYTVTFTLSGFATVVQENVLLTVGQAVALNPSMKVSGVAETVTVTTGTSTVETTRTAATTTLNETTVSTTPILGRKFEDLLTLTPGVSIVQGPDGDEITFSGQRGMYNNISLDGGDYNNGFFGEQMGGQRAAIDITLDAVKEFQVVATGANAEFGRTAGGVVNVITKSGTNDAHGSVFHFQRLEALTSNTSDGKPLQDFWRSQFGGTVGGPIKRDKAFFFLAFEGIRENFTRPNLSEQIGDVPCPVSAPTVPANEALIRGNVDCQRLSLITFFRTQRQQEEGQPIDHKISNNAVLGKLDWVINPSNNLSVSHNFNYSRNTNQTFDVATYGNSANGIEGPSKINVTNLNLFTTFSGNRLNEFHFTYSRENRPRSAIDSNVPADTGMDFANPFRFGNPYFLGPNVDELLWRTQIKNNFSIIAGRHTIKVGGEWLHSLNDQVFRGFFNGRYVFDSAVGFIRYASPAAPGGFGPNAIACSNGSWVTHPTTCPAGSTVNGTPLLLYIQESGTGFPGVDPPGKSVLANEDVALFIQDQWEVRPNLTLNYGLRWDAQFMADTVDPASTAYAPLLNDPRFPSDGTIPDQTKQFQPRLGVAWDVTGKGRSVIRGNVGLYYARNNMLSQAGSVTANGLQNQGQVRGLFTGLVPGVLPMPVWPNTLEIAPLPPGQFPLFTNIRVTARDYENPRITTANIAYEQEIATDWAAYFDFTWSKGDHLSQFLNYNSPTARGAPFGPQFGDVFVHTSLAEGKYRGATFGLRKRLSNRYQLEANYVLSKDEDSDSSERDPFTDRTESSQGGCQCDLALDQLHRNYSYSDRDIRHKFNFFGYGEAGPLRFNARVQARSAQPITPTPRFVGGQDLGRNSSRKENEYFSLDWRVMWPIRFGGRYELIPMIEMFNTFNNANNINPLITPALINFDGFLRLGVGDPRQVQLAAKLRF